MKIRGISLQLLLHLSFFSLSLHTLHIVLNTSMKVSGNAHPLFTSQNVFQVMLGYG